MKPLRLKVNWKILLITALAVVLLGNRGFRALVKNYMQYHELKVEKARLETRGRQLQKQLKDIGEKPAIEQAARRELSMIHPEETEYRFPPPSESDK